MSLYEKIVSKQEKLALVGLGYVGMPIAVAFAKRLMSLALILTVRKSICTNKVLTRRKRLEMKPSKQLPLTLQTMRRDFRRQSLSSWLFPRL